MARRKTNTYEDQGTEAERPDTPETTGATADDGHMDFNDPETGAGHDAGGDDGLGNRGDEEPEPHDDKHQDDGKPDAPEGPNHEATAEVLDTHDGAEPEKEYDLDAAEQDTDNTHTDGGNGLHQEDYIDGDDAAELAVAEAEQHRDDDDTSLHSSDIGRRINTGSRVMVHSTLAPANRDETMVGDHPEQEKGLRPLAPLDGQTRTDDAGRPYDGDSLHTVEKGLPVGQGVIEHVHAPTASGGVPEGILSARAPVPVSGHERDPARYAEREHKSKLGTLLGDAEHRFLDLAEDMRIKGAVTFTLAQIGATVRTAENLVEAGLLKAEAALGGDFFPNGNKIYSLTDLSPLADRVRRRAMSNRGPFLHPDLALARMLLVELRSFAHPDLENDYHAQRAACRVIDRIREEINGNAANHRHPDPARNSEPDPDIIDWNEP